MTFLFALLLAAAPTAPTAEQAQADANQLRELYAAHRQAFAGIDGDIAVRETTVPAMLEKCAKVCAQIERLEQDVLPVIQPVLARLTETYGKTGSALEWAMKQAGATDLDFVATRFDQLSRLLTDLQATRRASAQFLAGHVQDRPPYTFYPEDRRLTELQEIKTILHWAVKLDPKQPYANQRLAQMDREIAEMVAATQAEIDEREWRPSVDDFPGPGTVAELTRAALEYFRNDEQWGKSEKQKLEILAASVRGPWAVAETDIFGRVTQWRLPIHLAMTKPDYREQGLARVYELSVVARAGEPGRAVQAPPFEGFWVGESWMIRLPKVPAT